ncbi:hypothetical protein [Algoriphagus mannitolivorans]|uniref:hypothetical protein n=1 Tax=Algoriphagus mannitolivorans TaxID=226504 RepID=UPI0003F7711D|nr:hypothetical protein [Algoriphagus mannitolivorans]
MKPLYFLLFFAVILVLGGVDRGFDISDEGLYALLAHPLQDNFAGIFNYDLFFKACYKLFNLHFGLIELRIIRLLSYFLGAFALAVFLRNVTKANKIQNLDFGISLLGLLAAYAFLPQTLSYNHLSVVLTCFWLALISGNIQKPAVLTLLGLVLALLAYVKIPTAVLLFLGTFIFVILQKAPRGYLVLLLIPFVLLELIFFYFLQSSAIQRLWSGLGLMIGRPDYALITLVKHTLVGVFWIGLSVGGSWMIHRLLSHKSFKFICLFLWLSGLIWLTHITEEWNHVALLFTAQLFGILGLRLDMDFWKNPARNWILLLAIMPFLLHFGSNVYWLRIGIHYWVFWILALFIWTRNTPGFQAKTLELGLGILTCILIFTGVWWRPFEQKSLWNYQVNWEYLPGKSIKLMPEQVQKLKDLQSREDIQSQQQLLAVYRISGIPFLLGKTMPKSPGFWDENQLKGFFLKNLPDLPLIYNPISDLPYRPVQDPILLTEF